MTCFSIEILTARELRMAPDNLVIQLERFGSYLPDPLQRRVSLLQYAKKLHDQAEILFLRDKSGTLLAVAAFYANDRHSQRSFLTILAVDPRARGRGFGRTLMQRAIARARSCSMRTMELEVSSTNSPAVGLYQALGFKTVEDDGARLRMLLRFPEPAHIGGCPVTPLQEQPAVGAAFNLPVDLRVKRDDLFPESGGGNKARKAARIVPHIVKMGHTIVVTNGSLQSNHARATALTAAQYGIACHLVLVGIGAQEACGGNLSISRRAATSLEYCNHPEELAERMDKAMQRFRGAGHNPFYLWGGGHCLQGTLAIADGVREFQVQAGEWQPDVVVVASGTGTTQAGIIGGFGLLGPRVIGVSVARSAQRGAEVVRKCLVEYCEHVGQATAPKRVEFRDEWTCGGYGRSSQALRETIGRALQAGFTLDSTYSGKSFMGLVELVGRKEIERGARVLYWHTGGLMNLVTDGDDSTAGPTK